MTFQELLLNLMGTRTSRKLKVIADDWEGELLIKGDEIIRVEVHNDEELFGMDALKFMLNEQENIDRIEFLPYQNAESNVRVGQMDLFLLIQEESPDVQEEVSQEKFEEFFVPELEKKEKAEEDLEETPGRFLEVCKKYFKQENLKLVYCKGRLEFSSLNSPEDALSLIENLVQKVRNEDPCGVKKILLKFNRAFCLILISGGTFGAVAADIEEYPNYELDQPFIEDELSEALLS